jgi:hypothetical protein
MPQSCIEKILAQYLDRVGIGDGKVSWSTVITGTAVTGTDSPVDLRGSHS